MTCVVLAQYTDFDSDEGKVITMWKDQHQVLEAAELKFPEPNEMQLNVILNLEPHHLVRYDSQPPDNEMLFQKPVGSQYVCFFVQLDTILFKKCVYQKFPKGAWAGIKNPVAHGTMYGQLWINPSFTYQELQQYYIANFGANVSVGKLMLAPVMPTPSPSDEPDAERA